MHAENLANDLELDLIQIESRFTDIHVSLCQEKSTVVLGVLGRARIATLQDSPHANEPLG
jgi:hypothetical protein